MSINLLPWREGIFRRKKRLLILAGSSLMIFIFGISVLLYCRLSSEILAEEKILVAFKTPILLASSVEELQAIYQTLKKEADDIKNARKNNLKFQEKLSWIIEASPPGIALRRLSFSEANIRLEGFSAEKLALENYMNVISKKFKHYEPNLASQENSQGLQFNLSLNTSKA